MASGWDPRTEKGCQANAKEIHVSVGFTGYQSLFINCDKTYPAASVYVYLKSGADVIRKVLKTIKQQATQPSHRGADSGRRGRRSRLRPRAGERAKRHFK